ncbi:hypothetical protein FHR20_003635 [Sphingomonas leidyi]|uniref:Uncharacterized protein n=1 Tax=Sphingomonas leidyi TaxID=68569 RepID=A0A7X5ZXB3_9SPHN|nr:hypothetical protein [Sphingomonas leidyi]NIJ66659.1 hypothetical protein [Sphingomonas leidyi]
MRIIISIMAFLSCSACSYKEYVLVHKDYSIKNEIFHGREVRVLYLYVDRAGARIVNSSQPGFIFATKKCSYERENIGEVNFASIADTANEYPKQETAKYYKSNTYMMKFLLKDNFKEWRNSGSFCLYYHASRAFGTPEVFSNILRMQ